MSEPVTWIKEKYTVRKTKGRHNSKSNDQGKSTRRKSGKPDQVTRTRVLVIRDSRRVWEWRDA